MKQPTTDQRFENYHRRLDKSLSLVILLLITFFQVLPKKYERKTPELLPVKISISVVSVPITRQRIPSQFAMPRRPSIPLPVEEPSAPEDVVVPHFQGLLIGNSDLMMASDAAVAILDTIPPRPMIQVMPEYSEELQKNKITGAVGLILKIGVDGKVTNVYVRSNTTGSEVAVAAAIAAAYKSRYQPARIADKIVAKWTLCTFSFKPN